MGAAALSSEGTRHRGRDHMATPEIWPLPPRPQPSTGIVRAAWTDRGKCFNALLCRFSFSDINRNIYKAEGAFLGMTRILHFEKKINFLCPETQIRVKIK